MSEDTKKTRWQDILALDKLLPVLLGAILAIGASYFTTKFQMSSQLHLQKVEEQRRVFARLMGRKFTTEQLYVSRYEALIFSDYSEELWKRAGKPKDSLDLQEAQRWMHRSEDLVFEIVKNDQALFEDLATVRALFPDTPQLRDLCDHVYGIHSLFTAKPPHEGSVALSVSGIFSTGFCAVFSCASRCVYISFAFCGFWCCDFSAIDCCCDASRFLMKSRSAMTISSSTQVSENRGSYSIGMA